MILSNEQNASWIPAIYILTRLHVMVSFQHWEGKNKKCLLIKRCPITGMEYALEYKLFFPSQYGPYNSDLCWVYTIISVTLREFFFKS